MTPTQQSAFLVLLLGLYLFQMAIRGKTDGWSEVYEDEYQRSEQNE